mgnify:CR=1 FL=1
MNIPKGVIRAGKMKIVIADPSQARTITFPDPAGAANVMYSNAANTHTGIQTYDTPNVYDHNTTISAGATQTQAGATALTGEFNNVTTVTTSGKRFSTFSIIVVLRTDSSSETLGSRHAWSAMVPSSRPTAAQ